MVEVKGRVRLSAFGKFVQELPLSRSRVLMVFRVYYLHYHCSRAFSIRFTLLFVTTSTTTTKRGFIDSFKDPQNLISILQVITFLLQTQ